MAVARVASTTLDDLLGETPWLLSHADALASYGRDEEAAAEFARAATAEERVADRLEAEGRGQEALVHRASAASCYERIGQYARAIALLRAALSNSLPPRYRQRLERRLHRSVEQAQKDLPKSLAAWFEQLLGQYEKLVDAQFPALKRRFEPGGDFEWGVHVSTTDGRPAMWCLVRRQPGELRVTSSADVAGFTDAARSFAARQAAATGMTHLVWRRVPSVEGQDAPVHARQLVDEQIRRLLNEAQLVESWHLVYERAWRGITSLAQPSLSHRAAILEIDLSQPVTPIVFRAAVVRALATSGSASSKAAPLDPGSAAVVPLEVAGSHGPVNLAELDHDLRWLEEQGRTVCAPLLPEPDLEWEDALEHRGEQARFIWGRYSDARIREAAERAYEYWIAAYREMAEVNFPDACRQMKLYQHLPLQVDVVIDRTRRTPGWPEGDAVFYVERAKPGPRDPQAPSTVSIRICSGSQEEIDRARGELDRFSEEAGVLRSGGSTVTRFIRAEEWRRELLSDLQQDFLQVWEPHQPPES